MLGCGRINCMVMIIILWLLMSKIVKMEDEVVPTRDVYGCWGGCYNNCFLLQKNSDDDKTYQCYYNCLNNCTPISTPTSSTTSSPLNYGSLCQGGCFLMICIPLSFGK